ncbi:MAG: nuclear transport factor 2 family protein [Candidatus Acidiferrales bacterium]
MFRESDRRENAINKFVGAALLVAACVGLVFARTQTLPAKDLDVAETVKQLEHDWVEAAKIGDTEKVSQILADDWIGIGYDGSKETKQDHLADMKSGRTKLESFEFGPMDVMVLGNVAVVQGSNTEKSSTADGKDSSGKYAWMDVFVKRDGKWVIVRSQSTESTISE